MKNAGEIVEIWRVETVGGSCPRHEAKQQKFGHELAGRRGCGPMEGKLSLGLFHAQTVHGAFFFLLVARTVLVKMRSVKGKKKNKPSSIHRSGL